MENNITKFLKNISRENRNYDWSYLEEVINNLKEISHMSNFLKQEFENGNYVSEKYLREKIEMMKLRLGNIELVALTWNEQGRGNVQ